MIRLEAADMRSLSRAARRERCARLIRLREAEHTYDEIAAPTGTGLSRTGVFDICKCHETKGAQGLHDAECGRKANCAARRLIPVLFRE